MIFQAWPQAKIKALPGRPLWESYSPPHKTWCMTSTFQSLQELQSRTQVPLASHALSHICIPSPGAFFLVSLSFFIWGLEQNLLQVLLLGPPYGREEGDASKTLFSILSTHSFPTPGAFLSPSLWPQGPHHKTSRTLFTAPSIVRWPLYMFWSTWPWPDVLFHGGKWNRHNQRFFWCWTPLTPSQQVVKGLLGHSWLVALTGYSDTWQLSSSFSSSSAELVMKGAHWELKWNWKLWTPLNFLEANW